MDDPVVEVVELEKLENTVDNIDKSSDNTPENPENPPKKNGRPKGSKDSSKRVVTHRPRKKIEIVEEPLHANVTTVTAAPEAPVVMKTPKPRAVAVNIEPEIRYIEHSPRSLIRNAHSHIVNEQKSKHDARKERFSDMILRSLR
jgi:hypothetical protein